MRFRFSIQLFFVCLALHAATSCADEVEYVISGVEEPLLTNVLNHVSVFRVGSGAKINSRVRRKLLKDAKSATARALRPFGYFNPTVDVGIGSVDVGKWQVDIEINAGPPVRVLEIVLEVSGEGSELPSVKAWRKAFPLRSGKILNQQKWDKAKLEVLSLLEDDGYLQSRFTRHLIRVDPVANTANLELVLETGLQALMGEVRFNQDILNDGVLRSLRRFEQGDAYDSWILEKFRLDLWRSGYFEDIEVVERRHLGANPPRVDLDVNVTPRKKSTYQGTVGFGTDTLVRFQLKWGRHLLSRRGDNFDIGFGWQQKDNEFTFQANYRLPRETKSHQYWIATLGLKQEKQTFKVSNDGDLENRFDIARGTVNDYSVRLGKTRVRNMQGGFKQLFETPYVQYLNEKRDFTLSGKVDTGSEYTSSRDPLGELLVNTSTSLAVGIDWDWPDIIGSGFETTGHHERAWMFTSNTAWGSDVNFSQVYLSSRWNFLVSRRWKILLRAEAGYSDAKTALVLIPVEGQDLSITATELPHLYRFEAGGSRSVRGYGFETLDDNGLGSNNILAASVEAEYHFHEKWSLAAFADIGNAFNDWSKPGLKLGTGLGLRWYSIIGALRLDVAKGWDLDGAPWRIHLTIGTPLF